MYTFTDNGVEGCEGRFRITIIAKLIDQMKWDGNGTAANGIDKSNGVRFETDGWQLIFVPMTNQTDKRTDRQTGYLVVNVMHTKRNIFVYIVETKNSIRDRQQCAYDIVSNT